MAYLRCYDITSGKIKIHHRNQEFCRIGTVEKINNDLNICKVKFLDINEKERSYWFHLFTGNVVKLPKENERFATDVNDSSSKAYCLSNDPIELWDIDPTLDILYKDPNKSNEEEQEESEEDKTNRIY